MSIILTPFASVITLVTIQFTNNSETKVNNLADHHPGTVGYYVSVFRQRWFGIITFRLDLEKSI